MTDNDRAGSELPFLLLGAFRSLIDQMHGRLEAEGHPEARPVHGFALQAIGPDGTTASELGRRLGVSKQAAAKTVTTLERAGYVSRESDPADGRAVRLCRTPRGEELLALSAAFLNSYHEQLESRLGRTRVAELEADLQAIASQSADPLGGVPGWMA